MTVPHWLKQYYGKDFGSLNPKVIKEGKTYAIVQLAKPGEKGFSAFGFVLIKKKGSHIASEELVLHEGIASAEDMQTMIHVFKTKDGEK